MKFRIAVLLSAVAALLCAPAHAGHDAAATAAAQAAPVPQRGTLYRIRHHGQTSYLFGTIHVGVPTFFPLESEVTRALAQASKLVLEIDIRNDVGLQAALLKHGMYGADDDIGRHLPAPLIARLQAALQRYELGYEGVRRYKPWLLANLLLGLDLERSGFRRAHGIEVFLLSQADGQAKAVQELESAEYQMALFDGMDETTQAQYLGEQLAELEDGNAMKKAQALIAAWAGGDGAAVEAMLRESLRENTLSSEFNYRVLLEKRNPEMAEKIAALLEGSESAFVGVGLLHLVGEGGVPKLLRERGFEVEKVY
jgi:uncharacterized protein YbaP (TraB family)